MLVNNNNRLTNFPLQESHELNRAFCLCDLLYCDVVLFGGRKTADRSWNLWDVFAKQKHECYTEFSVTIRRQIREEKKIVLGKASDRELSLVSAGTH